MMHRKSAHDTLPPQQGSLKTRQTSALASSQSSSLSICTSISIQLCLFACSNSITRSCLKSVVVVVVTDSAACATSCRWMHGTRSSQNLPPTVALPFKPPDHPRPTMLILDYAAPPNRGQQHPPLWGTVFRLCTLPQLPGRLPGILSAYHRRQRHPPWPSLSV